MNAARCRARRSCISIIAASSRALVDIDVSTRSTFGQAGSHVKTHVNDAVSVTPDSFRGPTRLKRWRSWRVGCRNQSGMTNEEPLYTLPYTPKSRTADHKRNHRCPPIRSYSCLTPEPRWDALRAALPVPRPTIRSEKRREGKE